MAFKGALVTKAADLSVTLGSPAGGSDLSSGGNLITWDTEVFDTDGFHDNSVNPGRMTIPLALNGATVVLTANIYHSAMSMGSQTAWITFRKNGSANFIGNAYDLGNIGEVATSGTNSYHQVQSAPIPVLAGDYFEVWAFHNDAGLVIESDRSSFGIRVVPQASPLPTFQGVLCKKNADQIGVSYAAATAVAWDGADVYDTNAAHDPASNNTKIIIPSAWNGKYGVFTASVTANNVTSNNTKAIKIRRGGVDAWDGFGGRSFNTPTAALVYGVCVSQAVLLATAQEYEAVLICSDTSIDILAANSSFGCRIVG